MEEKFSITNASAGSGKTFSLTQAVLSKLFSEEKDSYKKILALTFTNNSANEMKRRILDELNQISTNPEKSAIFQSLNIAKQYSKKYVIKKSKELLNKILHNFSFFQISTIDKFNHRLIRSFSSDLSLSYNFDLIIENDEFSEDLISNFINDLKKDSFLMNLLINYSQIKQTESKSWDITYDLKNLLEIIWDENNHEFINENTLDKNDFNSLAQNIKLATSRLISEIKSMCNNIEEEILSSNLSDESFSYKALPNFLEEVKNNNFRHIKLKSLTKRLLSNSLLKKDFLNDDGKVFMLNISAQLQNAINSVIKLKTYLNLNENLTLNFLTKNIIRYSKQYQKENNLLLISDFNSLISENISGQPTPFIYEKIGTRFNNYYIDEFQDTSKLQWNNLIPLVSHAITNEEDGSELGNLFIVGDPKQSIYGWRGANPETFNNLNNQNPFFLKPSLSKLGKNFRSFSEIINFNNNFFTHLSGKVKIDSISSNYSSLKQKTNKLKCGGYVSIKKFESTKSDYKENVLKEILSIINKKKRQKFKSSDIAILARTNPECNAISSFLMNNNIEVNSEELLALSSSKEVMLIIDIIRLFYDQNDLEAKKNILKYISIRTKRKNKFKFISKNLKLDANVFFNQVLNLDYDFYVSLDLYEAAHYITDSLRYFTKSTMQVNFLLEELYIFNNKNYSEKKSFIEYWNLKKDKLKVNLIQENNAVKVLTIHKSKGLEFPIVILPFFDFKLNKLDDKVWVSFLDKVVKGNFILSNSEYLKSFDDSVKYSLLRNEEKIISENVNVMYVALSRAILENHVLIKSTSARNYKSANDLVCSFFDDLKKSKDQNFFKFGKSIYKKDLVKKTTKRLKIIDDSLYRRNYNKINSFIKLKETNQEIIFGNLFHKIMSEIEHSFQVDITINSFYNRGLISVDDKKYFLNTINSIVKHPQLKPFFERENIIYNEREIFIPPNSTVIPDKTVILDDGSIQILDYKTGKKNDKYLSQLKKYTKTLRAAKYDVRNAFLVYVNKKIEVVEVVD